MPKVKLGIVGGNFSLHFLFHKHPDCEVVAVAELRPERLEKLQQHYCCANCYHSLAGLLRDPTVEAVGIFTPAPLHAEHSVRALKAGKHVLSAVPAAFTLEECQLLYDTVRSTGLLYMMAETSYYRKETIQARTWYNEGKFGELFYTEGEYWHEKLETLMFENGAPTWRHGFPPMHYPTHSTAFLTSVTGERLTRVQCIGWGDSHPILRENVYNNPFWNEIALFQTNRNHASRMIVGWHVGHPEVERATWFGSDFSFAMGSPIGFSNTTSASLNVKKFDIPDNYNGLPEALQRPSGHGGSHTHLVNEFITAVRDLRRPVIDITEALAYTVPGIIAHQSALKGGESLVIPQF